MLLCVRRVIRIRLPTNKAAFDVTVYRSGKSLVHNDDQALRPDSGAGSDAFCRHGASSLYDEIVSDSADLWLALVAHSVFDNPMSH